MRRDRLGQLVNRGGEISDLRLELVDVALLQLRLALVRVQRIRAEVLVLDLVLLLLQKGLDHLIDGSLHLRERIQADAARTRRETRAVKALRRLEQHLRSRVARGLLRLRLAGHLHEVERAGERVVRLVARQDGKRLAARLDLLLPRLHALLVLRIRHLAGLLQVHQELLVRRQGVPRVLKVLLVLRQLRVRVSELLRLLVLQLGASLDLVLLRRLQVLVRLLRLHLLLLRVGQVRLEGLLHLLQDAKDRAALRGVALLERRLRIEVVTRRLHERRDGLALGRRDDLLEHVLVLVELPLNHRRDVDQLLRRHRLQELVVLAQHDDRGLQRADRLQHVLLLRVELRKLFLAHRRGLVQSLLVLRDLSLEILDLRVQAGAHRRTLLDGRREGRDAGLRLLDGRRLLLVVRLAPASELLVDFLILLSLLLELRLHVLDEVHDLRDRVLGCVLTVSEARVQTQGCLDSNNQRGNEHHYAGSRALLAFP